jgi:hypothetical protein
MIVDRRAPLFAIEDLSRKERRAFTEARRILRQATVIGMTNWTFDQYDDADVDRVEELLEYRSQVNQYEREALEKQQRQAARGRRR